MIEKLSTIIPIQRYAFYAEYEGVVMNHKYLHGGIIASRYHERKRLALEQRREKVYAALRKDPRASLLTIAQRTGLNYETVKAHWKALHENGVLLRCVPVLNVELLGYKRYLCLLDLAPGKNDLQEYCNAHQNIIRYGKCLGHFGFIMDIHAKDESAARNVLLEIRAKFPDVINAWELFPMSL
jgi:DNA-binding Lrp family transcriptional regulator